MLSSFLFSKPVLCISSFIIGIAFCIQIDLILNGVNFQNLFVKLLLQFITLYSKSSTPYNTPTSIGNHITIEHNLCSTKFNGIASCQLVALNTLLENNPSTNYTHILHNKPHTLLKVLDKMHIVRKQAPLGTYYEYFVIEALPALLIHTSPKLTKKKLFANGVIVYLHGGAYITDNAYSRHKFMSYLHLFTGLPVLGVDYRLAPQYPLQSGALLEDGEKVIMNYLHKHLSVDFNQIHLAGDSAGGGAILMWMHHFHKQRKYFGSVTPISPWTDLRVLSSGKSYIDNGEMDSMLSGDAMKIFQIYALGCRDMNGDLVNDDVEQCIANGLNELNKKQMNPITADWSVWAKDKNLKTKLLFIVSNYEVLRDDGILVHEKALKNGMRSEIIVADSRLHVLPIFVEFEIPEAFQLVARMASFLNNM